jgi:hypothetical protein
MKRKAKNKSIIKLIGSLAIMICSPITDINSQISDSLYEAIDSTNSIGIKEIMLSITDNTAELYTLPKAYNIGITTANKGRIETDESGMYYQIDSTWVFSSNFVHLINLNVNCSPRVKMEFNEDSTVLNLKVLDDSKKSDSVDLDDSKLRYRMICDCIEDYEEITLRKVDYFNNEFDWNCGSYKNWKRQLTEENTIDCSKENKN